jgi:hypothetical protein
MTKRGSHVGAMWILIHEEAVVLLGTPNGLLWILDAIELSICAVLVCLHSNRQDQASCPKECTPPEGLGKAVAVKVAEVQNMARHVLRNALVLWLSGQHLNRPCKSGEATKATGKQKWPTLRNVGIRYSARAWPCRGLRLQTAMMQFAFSVLHTVLPWFRETSITSFCYVSCAFSTSLHFPFLCSP